MPKYQESESEYSEEGSESGSGNESGSESEFEDEYGNDNERDCEIEDNLVMPQLLVSCVNQHKPNGGKCFQNKCIGSAAGRTE